MADSGDNETLLLLLLLSISYHEEDVYNGTEEGKGCGYVEYFLKGKVKANLETLRENLARQTERGLLSVCYQFCILVCKMIVSVFETCSTSQMHGIT